MKIIKKTGRKVLTIFICSVICMIAVKADNLSVFKPGVKWYTHYRTGKLEIKNIEKAMADIPGMQLTSGPALKKQTYACISHYFKKTKNWTGVKSISLFAKTKKKIHLKFIIACDGGSLSSRFIKNNNSTSFGKYKITLDKMEKRGNPDLTKVKSISIGLGLWSFDTSKEGFSIILTKLETMDTANAYIIPRPSEGVVIDAGYKDDWGYEDNLYNWTAPDYIYLNDSSKLIPGSGKWRGIQQLSGRFAFMMDDKNLYFLGLVADATPFEGSNPSEVWKNDTVELFLVPKANSNILRLGQKMSKAKGAQIIFDCGKNHNNIRVLMQGGKKADSGIKYKVIPKNWLINGKQTKGYILEAAIPLKLFPEFTKKRGAMLGYSIKLNDMSGISLIATPENLKPHANIKNFKKAYIEIVAKDGGSKIKFPAPAKNVFWPGKYTKGPGKIRIWDMAKAYRKKESATSERLYLNTLWAVQGVDDGSIPPNPENWRYMPLPLGIGWYTPVFEISRKNKEELSPREVGYGKLGKKKKPFFWYERLFKPDADFKDRQIYLTIDYVVKEAGVYLNKEFIGTVTPGNTTLKLSGKLKFGEENRLDLLLYTNVIPGISVRNGISGITGDIYLEAYSHKPVINDLWVKNASGMNGSFDMLIETKASEKPIKLKLQILNKAGKVLAEAEKKVAPSAGIAKTNIIGKCKNFKPWSPEKPNLFFARLQAFKDGKLIEDTKQRFGFRTFKIKDGHFLLNGKILRLRVGFETNPSGVMGPNRLKMLKKYGHNTLFMHSSNSGHNAPRFDKLDEEGFITFAATDKAWEDKMTVAEIRKYRNHPSIIGYVSDSFGQLDVNGFIHNPFSVSDTYYPESAEAVKLYKFLRRRNDLFKSIDPTRPYIPQGTGNFEGAFRNIHHYPCYDVNMLDRMMYFEPWSRRKNPLYPMYVYECAIISLPTLDSTHPEHKYPVEEGRMVKRMVTYEDASRYLGAKAFDGWRQWDRFFAKNSLRGFRTCGLDGFTPWVDDDIFLAPANTKKAQDIKDKRKLSYKYFMLPFNAENLDKTWMRMNSWYYRLRGIARWQWPEEYGQGKIKEKRSIFTSIYENEMQPLFVYIGGQKGEVFSLAHNYASGESINKQIVAVNDTEKDFTGKFKVIFSLNGRKETKEINIKVPQGQIIKTAFQFAAPSVSSKTYGNLKLEYTNPQGQTKTDEFKLAVFPKKDIQPLKLDWKLKTGAVRISGKDSILKKAGIPFQKVSLNKKIPQDIELLVIERNALTKNINSAFLKEYIDNGGQVLIMEQSDKSLLDWRLRERRLEAVFIADGKHPIVKGLSDEDLAYFRGASTIIPREKRPTKYYRHTQSAALDTPHLTNVGIVAAYVMQKPSYGSFMPILVGGYDLEESALIEMRSGKGRAILCQVDVTGRYGLDPAATLLTNNIFKYLAETRTKNKLPSVDYLGGAKGKQFLERIGVTGVTPDSGKILAIGDKAKPEKELLEKYETVIILPVSNYLPEDLTIKPVKIQALDNPYFWNTGYFQFSMLKSKLPAPDRLGKNLPGIFQGLVDNDVYFFESPTLKSYSVKAKNKGFAIDWHSKYSTLATGKSGKTQYVLCSVNPYAMQHGECKRKAWRIWSLVFANLKVASKFELNWKIPAFDISEGDWMFLTDPDGKGEKTGFQNGIFGGRKPGKIEVGKIWEEAGVNDINPNLQSAPDSAYDGFGWYFRKVKFSETVDKQDLYLEISGVRDIPTYSRTVQQTTLWINGRKMPEPIGVYNAHKGGRGGRLWKLPKNAVKPGQENFVAVQIFNSKGAGGIHRKPIRFENYGQNQGMLFPYQFIKSKYNPYFFWCW